MLNQVAIHSIKEDHIQAAPRLKLGRVADNIRRQLRLIHGRGCACTVKAEVADFFLLTIFKYREILRLQVFDRLSFAISSDYIHNHKPRIGTKHSLRLVRRHLRILG
jgi:hypothetical protein